MTPPIPPSYADTLSISDAGPVLVLTFYGPAKTGPGSDPIVQTPVAAIAIPRSGAVHIIKAVQDALRAATVAKTAPSKKN